MKKLMIAAAIVCAAVLAQASCSLSWKAGSGVYYVDQNGNYFLSKENLVLVNLGSTIDWDNATEIAIATGTTPGVGETTLKNTDAQISGKIKWNWADGSDENLIDNDDYLALMYKDEKGDLQKLSYYNDGDPVEVGNEAVYKVSGISNNSYSKTGAVIGFTGNYMQAVPEPTSGLLLLLGVAGLALRRRRA